jgi:hypothetical protein
VAGNINKDTKTRIDMYIKGSKGYINNQLVDYSIAYSNLNLGTNVEKADRIYLNNFKNRKFKEIFSQYAYEGDTITDEYDELVSLTGTKQISTKIVITYQLMP